MDTQNTEQENQQEENNTEELLKKCEEEKNEFIDLSRRLKADLVNYKKEQEKTMNSFVQFASTDTLLKLLPVIDSFHLAFSSVPDDIKDNNWVLGMESIKQQMDSVLKDMGVVPIPAVGEIFDPELHEAVGYVDSEDDGKVMEEMQKGYMLHGKVIRAAKVKVAHKKDN